jgi:hypothetical protein
MNRENVRTPRLHPVFLTVLLPLFFLSLSGCRVMGDKESILPQEGRR